jgi:isochorismate pyruvate lyase
MYLWYVSPEFPVYGGKEVMMKSPEECKDIQDIRAEIDALDQEIIKLIAKRSGYVKAAAKFKANQAQVKAADRVKAMLEKRKAWAKEEGLEPSFIKDLFKQITGHFIGKEMREWEKK